jgi:phosphoribosylformylglycinamidine (FGAM) synthase PurS component
VAGGVGSILSSHQICVTSQNDDPRALSILRAAPDLGITSLRHISISDLVFFRGEINQATQSIIEDLLVDPLLQHADWNSASPTADFIVETSLHSGVTDSTTNELERLAKRMHLPITGVASGKRYTISGNLAQTQLQQLISQLLANPIIERWSINAPITPTFIDADATTNTHVEYVQITANRLRSGMGYAVAATLPELHQRARFMRVTTAGREESHPHDVTITHEAPNYHSS